MPTLRDDQRAKNEDAAFYRGSPPKDAAYDSWLVNDWAGRELVKHYLFGGGRSISIWNNQQWADYLASSSTFTSQVKKYLDDYASFLVTANKGSRYQVNLAKEPSFINGEAATGYNYLHGAHSFQMIGDASVQRTTSYTRVALLLSYIWNDVIDAEETIYGTDRLKNQIAHIISLGYAKPYSIKIRWDTYAIVVLCDSKGKILKREGGWPF
jgi:hypothetical protein